ncbi:MAG: hypothetical protein E7048_03465 [Lentisphaerae bacterium]|nr:hypothetical protein [Lentisphaerota bacterium]MBR2872892.1 hypothetical protein [Lentisphaeria bacterium]
MSEEHTFTTSLQAQKVARAIVLLARERGFIDGQLATAPELGEIEKQLFLKMFAELRANEKIADCTLSGIQMSALFTFVFAKAAETAAQIYEGVTNIELDTEGMLSVNVPIAAGELLNSYGAELDFPDICMARFVELSQEPEFENPFFSLFEALKWCYRISFHIFWEYLEQQNR